MPSVPVAPVAALVKEGGATTPEDDSDEDARAIASAADQESNAITRKLTQQLETNMGPGVLTRTFVRAMHPPLRVELGLKICYVVVLYALTISLMVHLTVWGYTSALDRTGDGRTEMWNIATPTELKIELTACVLRVTQAAGGAVRFTDTTGSHDLILSKFTDFSEAGMHVSVSAGAGDCLVLSCVGPSQDTGYLTTALLEIGSEAAISRTTLEVLTMARSCALLEGANYGEGLRVVGDNALAQVVGVSVGRLQVDVDSGLVDIRHSRIPQASVTVGSAPVSVRLPEQSTTVLGVDAAEALCLSDAAGAPERLVESGGGLAFRFGSGRVATTVINVTRRSGEAQVFVSRGVGHAMRSRSNTHDSTAGAGVVAEATWRQWAEQTTAAGYQLLRFRAVGPGMDDVMVGLEGRGEWIYAVHGDVYIWHPASLFWIFTLGLFFPWAAREEVVLTSSMCTPMVTVGEAAGLCTTDSPRAATALSSHLGAVHAALWRSLAPSMQLRNVTQAELYFVQSPASADTSRLGFLSSIADGTVTKFKPDARNMDSLVQFTEQGTPRRFMDANDMAFVVLGFFVAIVGPCMTTVLLILLYLREREDVVKAQKRKLVPLLVSGYAKKTKEAEQSLTATELLRWRSGSVGEASAGVDELLPGAPEDMSAGMDALLPGAPAEPPEEPAPGGSAAEAAEARPREVPSTPEPDVEGKRAGRRRLSWEIGLRTIVAMKKITTRKQLEERVARLIDNGIHVFSMLDAALLDMWPGISRADGLPSALLSASMHFALVMSMCAPIFTVATLQYHNAVFLQTECALFDLIQGSCGRPSRALPTVLAVLSISAVCFMLFYTVLEYLSRQAHLLIFAGGRMASRRAASLRRWLLRIRALRVVRYAWWFFLLAHILSTTFFGMLFIMYLTLGACVVPSQLVPLLLALVAIVFVARTTFQSLQKVQEALKESLESLRDDLRDTQELAEAVEEVLRDLGFNSTQILLFTVAVCIQFVALIAFVLLGCSLFLSASSLVPSLISSGTVVLAASTSLRSGQLPKDYVKRTHATDKLNAGLERAQAFSASFTKMNKSKSKEK